MDFVIIRPRPNKTAKPAVKRPRGRPPKKKRRIFSEERLISEAKEIHIFESSQRLHCPATSMVAYVTYPASWTPAQVINLLCGCLVGAEEIHMEDWQLAGVLAPCASLHWLQPDVGAVADPTKRRRSFYQHGTAVRSPYLLCAALSQPPPISNCVDAASLTAAGDDAGIAGDAADDRGSGAVDPVCAAVEGARSALLSLANVGGQLPVLQLLLEVVTALVETAATPAVPTAVQQEPKAELKTEAESLHSYGVADADEVGSDDFLDDDVFVVSELIY